MSKEEKTINVVQYMRKPGKSSFSMERLFNDIRAHMPRDIRVHKHENRYISQGFFPRLYDLIRARWHQGDVNHVTGDIHFITYLLKKKRAILTIHDFVTLERLTGIRRWVFWLFWYWLPEKRCAVITVVSRATREQVLRHLKCDKSKIKVIPNHVSEEFQPVPKNFNKGKPCILHIGTNANKNLIRVAEALAEINCRLIVIGHLSDRQIETLEKCNISYENYAGLSRAALLEQYHQCDMLVFASTYEGFGLPIIEANAVGRPVVTSNCWSMPEVAGNAACLVNPYDVEDIRKGISMVIKDPDYRENLIRQGFENVKRFRVDNIARQYAELYRSLKWRKFKTL